MWSVGRLTEDQMHAMWSLLCQYADVFSQSELDMGRISRWMGSSECLTCNAPERRAALQFGHRMLIRGNTDGTSTLESEALCYKMGRSVKDVGQRGHGLKLTPLIGGNNFGTRTEGRGGV
ncbi:hypothetical protein E2C01_039110 [Portunus trituberculatus]|uniref:Uncharacterized protein n=1 Tax=Portunus trituberculatus TaxID=210409 RepID=A0A5B7FFZ9_PORTR|nr:hypothetical protein [Portunus trituberculatus]